MQEIDACDAMVNLTGENIFARRWNAAFKNELVRSRVESTSRIVDALARKPPATGRKCNVLVNASAIGYYGPREDEELTEGSPPGADFMAKLCVDWEAAAARAKPLGIRVVMVRTGVVFDRHGGALQEMIKPFVMLGFSGPLGSGRQFVSWIHHEDMTGILLMAIDNAAVEGPLNATAPQPVTNKELTKAQGEILQRPAWVPTPAFAVRLMLGEVAEVVTKGQRVMPEKALALGYAFRFPEVKAALTDTLA